MMQVQGRLGTGCSTAALGVALGWGLCRVAFAAGPGAVALPIGGVGIFGASGSTLTGHGAPGYLGVDIRDVRDDEIGSLRLKESVGAVILHVDHDAPAGKCGLRERDVILQMNGQAIEGEDQLRRMLKETPAGRTVSLVISRDGQTISLSAQMSTREEVERQAWIQHLTEPAPAPVAPPPVESYSTAGSSVSPHGKGFLAPASKAHSLIGALTLGSSYTGAMVDTMGPQLAEFFGVTGGGVLVHSVEVNSPAAVAGLHAGDVVVRVNAAAVTTNSQWLKLMRENKGKQITLVVVRDKKEQTLTMVPDSKKRSSVERPVDDVVVAQVGYSLMSAR